MYKITAMAEGRLFYIKEILLHANRVTGYAWTECEQLALNFTADEVGPIAFQLEPPCRR